MAAGPTRIVAGATGAAAGAVSMTAPVTVPRSTGTDAPTLARRFVRAVVLVLPAWIAARVLVVGALVVAHLTVNHLRPGNPTARLRVHQGLLAWDGGWYESIARHGYSASGVQSVRFYPAFPLAGRLLGAVPGIGAAAALVVMANLAALVAMAALVLLVRSDFGDPDLARRSAWLLGLAPSAYALVLGYADGLLLACSIGAFLGARTRRWWWAAAAGLAAGLVRPVGVLLVIPMAVEAWQQWRSTHPREPARADPSIDGDTPAGRLVATAAAIVAPLAGAGIFLGWVGSQFGDAWLPLRVQQQSGHRGGVTVPLTSMWHNVESVVHGHHLGSASHVPWALVCIALLVVAFRRLPLSYGLFASAALVVSLTSSNLDSFERYALGAFPLVIAASTLTTRRGVEATVLIVAAAAMTGYALLAFLGVVVP